MPRVSKGTRVNEQHKPTELPARYEPGFLQALDRRYTGTKGLKRRFEGIAEDLGGIDELSGIKLSLLERFIWLEATLVYLETVIATETDSKVVTKILPQWIQAVNSLLGIARTLGIERQAKSVDLKSYLAEKDNGK